MQAAPQLSGHVDGVAVHPYGRPGVVVARVRGARAALVGLGMGAVPLYITEFGWTTQPPGAIGYAPASRRPGEIAGVLTTLGHLACGLAATILYTWVTPERNPADPQDWFGIANPTDASAGTAGHRRVRRGPARCDPTAVRAGAGPVPYLMQLVASRPLRLQPSSARAPARNAARAGLTVTLLLWNPSSPEKLKAALFAVSSPIHVYQ